MADTDKKTDHGSAQQVVLGFLFGILFGFLLQKGGVAKYHVLTGVLLLEDFTVVKVMLTAVLVGMTGIYILHRFGQVELHLPPTRYAGNVIGGLVFGAGFGLSAYCPGTNAAALGQGNGDALAVAAGLVAGSWIYAEVSGRLKETVEKWGDRGKLDLPALLRLPRGIVTGLVALLLLAALFAIEKLAAR